MAIFSTPSDVLQKARDKINSDFARQRERLTRNFSRTPVEKISRAGLPDDVLQRLSALRPPIEDDGDSDFRFGKPSKFRLADEDDPPTNITVIINNFNDPVDPGEEGIKVFDYDLIDYLAEDIDIDIQVDDTDEVVGHVVVERFQKALFQKRDQPDVYIRLNFTYKERS